MRRLTAIICAAFIGAPVYAETISTKDVYACATITTDAERLACYDESVGRLQTAEATGEVVTVNKADVQNAEREAFGFSVPSLSKLRLPSFGSDENQVDTVSEPISKVSRDVRGRIIVTLENGQVWSQADSRRIVYSKRRTFETATIKRAALGSFKLSLDDYATFKATRDK